ncbi:MAG TPA: hypothetical protein VGQ20_05580, partial [Acidimicrobiales bacterium]|nr:hypothetical protein [Acidimicrobiales bacterium]
RALLDGLLHVSEHVSRGSAITEVWDTAEKALLRGLGLLACRYEPASESTHPLPDITLDELVPESHRFRERGWELPEAGAALPVEFAGCRLGRIVLVPGFKRGVSIDERRVALAIAAQVGAALSAHR